MTFVGNSLYAAGTPATGGDSPSSLFTLNPATGTATLIGATGINGPISGIAYDAANSTLYGIEGGTTSPYNLVSLNLSTGVATTVFSAGTTSFGSLSFGPDGNLYAGTSTGLLDVINLTNHTATPLTGFTALPSASAISGLTMGNDTSNVQTTVNTAVTLSPTTLPADTIDVAYNQTITASGGTGAVTPGGQQHPERHRRPDRPQQRHRQPGHQRARQRRAGTETFTVTATDAAGDTTTTNYSITVNPAITLSPATLPADTINVAYNQTITASGGTGAVTLAVSNIQNAIAGLIVPSSGSSLAISGTPTASGTETFTVTATDSVGGTTTTIYSITVNARRHPQPGTLPADTIDVGYNQTITRQRRHGRHHPGGQQHPERDRRPDHPQQRRRQSGHQRARQRRRARRPSPSPPPTAWGPRPRPITLSRSIPAVSLRTSTLPTDTINVGLQPEHHSQRRHRQRHSYCRRRQERHSRSDGSQQWNGQPGHHGNADGDRHGDVYRHCYRRTRRQDDGELLHLRCPTCCSGSAWTERRHPRGHRLRPADV